MTITTGKYSNHSNLNSISEYINKLCIGRQKAHHIWTEEVPKDIYTCIEDIRISEELLDVLKKAFPNSKITNVREADEIYWAVSPKSAKGSDRSLVDCHYDAPFAVIPTNSTYYRIIVACNENVNVETQFPNDKINVTTKSSDVKADKSIEGFDLQTTENNIKRGKQSNSIPVNQYYNQSIDVSPYEGSKFSNLFGFFKL